MADHYSRILWRTDALASFEAIHLAFRFCSPAKRGTDIQAEANKLKEGKVRADSLWKIGFAGDAKA